MAARARGKAARTQTTPRGRSTAPTHTAPAKPGRDRATAVVDHVRPNGNRAVVEAIQRFEGAPSAPRRQASKQELPEGGPSVRDALRDSHPGLLYALTAAQLDQWQAVIDHDAIKAAVQPQLEELRADHWNVAASDLHLKPSYRQASEEILRRVPPRPATRIQIPLTQLLNDDIQTPPDWDVQAEMAFRQWAVGQLEGVTTELDMQPGRGGAAIRRDPLMWAHHTKGFITTADLIKRHPDEYRDMVTHRQELRDWDAALAAIEDVRFEIRGMHRERSDKNAAGDIWIERKGWGLVRHISEALGTGDSAYPTIHIWDRPGQLSTAGRRALRERQFELAAPLIAQAEQETLAAANRFVAYEERVVSGGGRAVKTLVVAKKLGSLAAGIASGGLGLAGSALVAGGYTLVQEGGQQAAEVFHGERNEADVSGLFKQAGTAVVMTLVGGALQARFQAAIKLRVDQVRGLAGTQLGEYTASAFAAGTSSLYTTGIQLAIDNVVSGKALPTSVEDFADLVVDNAVENILFDVLLQPLNQKATAEYEAWKGNPDGATPIDMPGAEKPKTAADDTGAHPSEMSTHAVRRLLTRGGGWSRLRHELTTGTGLGQGLPHTERNALLARFDAHRRALAEDTASLFDGEVTTAPTPKGDAMTVTFVGENAAQRAKHAGEFLDIKQPGWRKRTGLELEAAPKGVAVGDEAAVAPLDQALQAEVGALSTEYAAIYADWPQLSSLQRLRRLADVANRPLVAAGYPPLSPKLMESGGGFGGQMDPARWTLSIADAYVDIANPTPQQFAQIAGLAAHEGRHGLQMARAIRTDPDGVPAGAVKGSVLAAVREGTAGKRRVEQLQPATPEHEQAIAWFRSMWGDWHKARGEVYAKEKTKRNGYLEAETYRKKLEDAGASVKDISMARVHEEVMLAEWQASRDAYRALPEEIDAYRYGNAVAAEIPAALQRKIDDLLTQHRTASSAARSSVSTFEDMVARVRAGTDDDGKRAENHRGLRNADRKMKRAFNRLERVEQQLHRLGLKLAQPR